jgi:hypothetical protein
MAAAAEGGEGGGAARGGEFARAGRECMRGATDRAPDAEGGPAPGRRARQSLTVPVRARPGPAGPGPVCNTLAGRRRQWPGIMMAGWTPLGARRG